MHLLLRSAYPRAKVLSIDSTQALAHPDCVAVFTAKDVPGNNKIGHLEFISDWDVMIPEGEITRYVGGCSGTRCFKKEKKPYQR
ncbi:hypothetical protein JG559_01920 [Enterococcus faecalis]|uniref:Aldehyde oxidase/xanthine dehydrogenase a/b hammerhead domain-containing protein n=1 Tax=Enterococcus faecalis TaxID=1351 RepID=A0A974NZB1_ENTFL|nr:hypothetical protein JG559_01920 [Enterococcus faecalis]